MIKIPSHATVHLMVMHSEIDSIENRVLIGRFGQTNRKYGLLVAQQIAG
jgi:hypothetical protein